MPEFLQPILDILHDLPGFLDGFVSDYGLWVYVLLFAIIFAETGLVIMPFLPGDSLLFAAGAVAARNSGLDPGMLVVVLVIAAVLGDAVNYHIGKWVGPRVFRLGSDGATRATPAAPDVLPATDQEAGATATSAPSTPAKATGVKRLLELALNRKHLDRAHAFFEKYGGKAVVLARFVPIVRTFIPFVAGAGAMNYSKFVFYNVLGAVLWVGICVGAGWFFGNIEWVQKNFEAVIIAIIVVSLIPLVVEYILARRRARAARLGVVGAGVGQAVEPVEPS
ncbi:MAG: VTT domain-containing protein [Phycisphaerales bacterium]|nr:VTT domain-containing protein [Phycisphaerales bacterium]